MVYIEAMDATNFKPFFSPLTKEQREDFARRCEISLGHLLNVMYGTKALAPGYAVVVERESKGAVLVESECPHENWVRIKDKSWPHPKGRPLLDASKQKAEA